MPSFISLKKIMRLSGVLHDPKNNRVRVFLTNCYFFTVFICYFISTMWYFRFHAKKLADYTGSFYFNCCSSLIFSWYVSYMVHRNEYADFFDTLDTIIEKRKFSLESSSICSKTVSSFLWIPQEATIQWWKNSTKKLMTQSKMWPTKLNFCSWRR